jgi:cell fate (sporulation/competence/biofilm development) regulator YlbF (YheA/YmcA/DUF963 family)
MEHPEVNQAADRLISAIRETETYREYHNLRQGVMADAESRALLRRYSQAQSGLQMAALAGMEPRQEDVDAFERLSTLLYTDDLLTDYLLAQMKVQKLVAELLERITQDVGLDVPVS